MYPEQYNIKQKISQWRYLKKMNENAFESIWYNEKCPKRDSYKYQPPLKIQWRGWAVGSLSKMFVIQ